MALPHKLKDFNLFGNGDSWQGKIAELALPKLTRKYEEYRGGGMDGAVEIDLGQEKIEFEWQPAGLIQALFIGYGQSRLDAELLRFVGAYQADDSGEFINCEVVVRGRHKEIDMGSAKPGDDNTLKVNTSCSYYKLVVGGKTLIEIDVPGYVFVVDGIDRLAEKRAALGV